MKTNFKDFWTHDMKQFYDESSGQENFNHEKIQSSMPVEPEKWKICPADQFYGRNKNKRGPFCMNCKERGHMQYECLKRQSLKCAICGLEGHFYYRCPSAVCTTCRNATQCHTTSCYNCHRVKFLQCSLCNCNGHEMQHCPDLWRRYHQTTTSKKMLEQSRRRIKQEWKLWCSNCANQGHSADMCRSPHQDRVLSTTQIFSYQATYINECNLEQPPVVGASNKIKKEKRKQSLAEKTVKYRIILEKLNRECSKNDTDSLELIKQYLDDIKNNKFSKGKCKKVNKLRFKIKC